MRTYTKIDYPAKFYKRAQTANHSEFLGFLCYFIFLLYHAYYEPGRRRSPSFCILHNSSALLQY
jgi:hypothetical protein